MVDTSRGYVDLKERLADNVTRQIHPQTMRDVVESFAHPVRGGGLDLSHVTQQDAFSVYAYNQHIPIAHNTAYWTSVNHDAPEFVGWDPDPDISKIFIYDPLGLVTNPTDDDPEPYGNHSGGKYLSGFPQGSVWSQHLHVGWEAGTFTIGDALSIQNGYPLPNLVYPDNYLDDTAGGIWGAPQYAYNGGFTGGWTGGNQQMETDSMVIPFYETDLFDGPWNMSGALIFQQSGETQYINNYQWDVWRII